MIKEKIGIWGLGAVGASALAFFERCGNPLELFDLRDPKSPDLSIIPANTLYSQQTDAHSIEDFFERNDLILASPGIDTTPYTKYGHKLITELDLVAQATTTPIIAITGTIGKTTVTSLLAYYLKKLGLSIGAGGNLGTPMLDLIMQPTTYDYLILELSSFQLEYTRQCASHLALWTNFYPNHLDRHKGITDYFLAKLNILKHQTAQQQTLLPLALVPILQDYIDLQSIQSQLSFFSPEEPTIHQQKNIPVLAQFFYIKDDYIVVCKQGVVQPLIQLSRLPAITYLENLLIVIAALHCMNQSLDVLMQPADAINLEHRLEHIATYNNITFYNDSKATIMQSTLAAVQALAGHKIVLLLGGLSKGIDRGNDIQKLATKVQAIICFGKEADELFTTCIYAQIPAHKAQTLEEAFALAVASSHEKKTVLFSPGGASFDAFLNYKERGKKFKELVTHYCNSQN